MSGRLGGNRASTCRTGARLLVLLRQPIRLLSLCQKLLDSLAKNRSLTEAWPMLQILSILVSAFVLGACTTIPSSPSILVLPGTGKSYDQFHSDELMCRRLAYEQVANSPEEPDSREEGQQDYDIGYIQCMYGKEHRVPVPRGLTYGTQQEWHAPPPPNLPAPPRTTRPPEPSRGN